MPSLPGKHDPRDAVLPPFPRSWSGQGCTVALGALHSRLILRFLPLIPCRGGTRGGRESRNKFRSKADPSSHHSRPSTPPAAVGAHPCTPTPGVGGSSAGGGHLQGQMKSPPLLRPQGWGGQSIICQVGRDLLLGHSNHTPSSPSPGAHQEGAARRDARGPRGCGRRRDARGGVATRPVPVPEERAAAQKPAQLVLEAPELTVQVAVQGRVPEPQVRRRFHRAARPLARPRGRFPAHLLQLLAFGAEKRTPSHPHAATQSPPSSTARPLPPPRWPCPDRLPGHQVKKEQARESGLLQRSPLEQTTAWPWGFSFCRPCPRLSCPSGRWPTRSIRTLEGELVR